MKCEICFEHKKEKFLKYLNCMHSLCDRCYLKLKKYECPFCREQIIVNSLPCNGLEPVRQEDDRHDSEENPYFDEEPKLYRIKMSKNKQKRNNSVISYRIEK